MSDTGMGPICDDLAAETADLVAILTPLDGHGWDTPTPAEGWTVRDQIAHLAFFDGTATLAATDPEGFAAHTDKLMANGGGGTTAASDEAAGKSSGEMLAWFTGERARMTEVFRALDPKTRVPWYGPPMAATSFATARLMETWAHGQDVADTFGVTRPATSRLRHVAHIGVRARPFSYVTNGRALPEGVVKVVLSAPDGSDPWVWNEEAGDDNVVSGPALDFCLVVTQRRHPADTALVIRGPLAEDWIPIAQAFAGPPGSGREPGRFS